MMMVVASILIILVAVGWLIWQRYRKSRLILVGLEDCRKVESDVCAWCSEPISEENYSSWDAFVANGYTQKLCIMCNGMDQPVEKEEY